MQHVSLLFGVTVRVSEKVLTSLVFGEISSRSYRFIPDEMIRDQQVVSVLEWSLIEISVQSLDTNNPFDFRCHTFGGSYSGLRITQWRKFFIYSLEYGLLLEAARLVVFRLVGCLRRNGLAGCWDGSVLLDLWGMCLKSLCIFVCLVFLGECAFSPFIWTRSEKVTSVLRAGLRSGRHGQFWGDMKWCLWKACWMFLIYVQLGFLVKNP